MFEKGKKKHVQGEKACFVKRNYLSVCPLLHGVRIWAAQFLGF